MNHMKLLAGLTLILSLAACGSVGTPPSVSADPAPLSSADTTSELGGAVASDVEQTLSSLSDTAAFGSQSLDSQANACRAADPASSLLDPAGRPLDSDTDGIPDRVVWLYTSCQRGGAVLNGSSLLSDPNADPTVAGSFVEQPRNLALSYTRADGSVRTETRNGSSTGTLTGRSSLNIARDITETISDTLHASRLATWKNQVTVQFTAAAGQTIDRRHALPAGTVSVNGPREWHVSDGTRQADRYLTIVTTAPLAFDPTCNSMADRIFGSSHARSGSFNVLVYGDAARTVLNKTVTVTYQDCAPTISSS